MASNSQHYRPLPQLVLARLRAFYREPSAVFWVYGFPLLMVLALGIAFRTTPVETVTVDVQAGPGAEETRNKLLRHSDGKGLIFKVQMNDGHRITHAAALVVILRFGLSRFRTSTLPHAR